MTGDHRRHKTVVGMAALAAGLLVVGEAGAGASSAVTIREPQYGFSFSLPANWKQVPLDGSDVTALLNSATHDDPSLANALDSEVTSAAAKGIKVFAVGPVVGSSVPNVNVIVSSSAGSPTGRAFAQAAVAQAKIEFAELRASQVKTSIVKNRLGTAAKVTYALHAQSATEFGEQFYVSHGPNVEIVTITTSSGATTQSTAQTVVKNWRW
jgi:hypothetical protein